MYNPNLSFHFIGIGGSGMSGLAEILVASGFKVSGSDVKRSATCVRLESLGCQIHYGHSAAHVPAECSSVVYSSAVSQLNPEMVVARERGIPCVRRAEVLAELMRLKFGVAVAGSHGKTTTTSMTAAVLSGLDPTVVIGGQLMHASSGARLGRGEYLIAESDESDKSFLLLSPTIAVVTNIDAEHLGTYGSLTELKEAFLQFAESVPFYGLAVICLDDPAARALAARCTRRTRTYGFSDDAEVRGSALRLSENGSVFEVFHHEKLLGTIELPMLGQHYALNCLAAIAVGLEFRIPFEQMAAALKGFSGVRRRLERVGCFNGATILSDYGHHPTEIAATIRALRDSYGARLRRLVVAFEPHRYTRTQGCFDEFCRCFDGADVLMLTEIYSAGEQPIEGISALRLAEAIRARTSSRQAAAGHAQDADGPKVLSLEQISESLGAMELGAGDFVLCLGAGSIGTYAERLEQELVAQQRHNALPTAGTR